MEAFLKKAIKNISLILLFLFIGIVTEFDWRFWSLFLCYTLWPFIELLVQNLDIRAKNHAEKLRQNRLKNQPPH